MVGGTVADALKEAGITLSENSVCNPKPETILTGETYIDVVSVKYVTETYDETIPYTAKVEYSNALKKGEKKVIEGKDGKKTVTVKKTYENGEVAATETLSTVVTKPATDEVTIIGTRDVSKKSNKAKEFSEELPYSSIKTISTLTAPSSLTLTSEGIPTTYKKNYIDNYLNPKGHGYQNMFSTAVMVNLMKNPDFRKQMPR